jgi:hypothetical protein
MRLTLKIFLLLSAFAGYLYATEEKQRTVFPNSDKNVIIGDTTINKNVDSTEIYYDLIADENADARYGQNIAGIIVGGALTGVGAYFLVGGIYGGWYYKSDDAGDEVFTKISGAVLFAASIPFLVIGIPVLTANTYYYIVHKNHAIKFNKYRESLKLYKQRRERENSDAVRLMIIPSVNFANASGGLNLLVAF